MISRSSIRGMHPVSHLGELVEFLDCQRRPVTESDRRSGPYPYFGANGQQGTIDGFIFDEPLVLLAEDGGHFETPNRGIAYRIGGKTWVNNHAHVLRPKSQVSLDYLCRVLENYDVTPFVTGTTRGKLTKSGAEQIPIPLPPLPEQRRIAAILDKADELRAKRRAALERLKGLTQAMFLEMFGDPASNPKGFPIGNIECLVKNPKKGDIRCGPFGTQLKIHEIVDSGVPLFGIENVLDEGFNAATSKFLTDGKAHQLKAFDVVAGDVLVTRMGTIGRACVVTSGVLKGRFSYHLFRIRPDESRCDPEFLAATVAHSGTFQSQLRLMAHGAIMDGLSTANLKAVRFLLPPVPLQREFARRVAKVQSVKATLLSSERTCDRMFASLQHHAFNGEL